jgi:hypothetical protein
MRKKQIKINNELTEKVHFDICLFAISTQNDARGTYFNEMNCFVNMLGVVELKRVSKINTDQSISVNSFISLSLSVVNRSLCFHLEEQYCFFHTNDLINTIYRRYLHIIQNVEKKNCLHLS